MVPIWVLNLARSVERRRHMEEQLARLGLDHDRIEAIDGAALGDSGLRSLAGDRALDVQPWLGRPMTPNEIGCALTHVTAWRRLAEGDSPAALVLEDDVDLGQAVPDALRGLESHGRQFGLVLLGHHSNRRPWIPGAPFDHAHGALTTFAGSEIALGIRVARLVEYAQGAYAYFLTRETARQLLRFANPIRMPADSVTGYAPRAGVRSYAVVRPCVVPTAKFATTMTDPRPCSCRVCARARMMAAAGVGPVVGAEDCVAERMSPTERARLAGGRAFLLARRLGMWPGAFWAPSFRDSSAL